MGEYATLKTTGERIKIGTCENLYYLRADQLDLLTARDAVAVRAHSDVFRFRFPFPDEDNDAPGTWDDYDRSYPVHVDAPAEIDHGTVQFRSSYPREGLLVSLPCPYSEEGKANGIKYQFNGYGGPVRLVQQRYWEGRLVAVCECGACGARYRLPELSDAEPLIVALRSEADQRVRDSRLDSTNVQSDADGRAQWLHDVADRIHAGYVSDDPFAFPRRG